jgi:peroxiredoxin
MMSENENYNYDEQWKKKSLIWRYLLFSALAVLIFIALVTLIPKAFSPTSGEPTPTVSYIQYGSRRIVSVIPEQVSYPAPNLALTNLDGQSVSLEDHANKVVLVNIWTTWCPGCEAEMPEYEAYYQTYREEGFIVIGVNAEESAAQISAFRQEMNLNFPLWLDPQKEVYRAFKSNHLPSSYIIDREGTVRLAWFGPISRDVLEVYVTPLVVE